MTGQHFDVWFLRGENRVYLHDIMCFKKILFIVKNKLVYMNLILCILKAPPAVICGKTQSNAAQKEPISLLY